MIILIKILKSISLCFMFLCQGYMMPISTFTKHQSTPKANLIFGSRAIIEAILAGRTIEKVLVQKKQDASPRFKELLYLLKSHQLPFSYVPIEKLNKLTNGNHQGIAAILSPIPFAILEEIVLSTFEQGKAPLLVMLDGVTDVHNIGAIARTARCMGADALVVPTHGSASLSGAAMKTSAGALATLPICRVTRLSQALGYLQASGFILIACTAEDPTQTFQQVDLKLPTVLILGNEACGIAPAHLKLATHRISISMQGPIASLNVSVAAGIMLYETMRQRTL